MTDTLCLLGDSCHINLLMLIKSLKEQERHKILVISAIVDAEVISLLWMRIGLLTLLQ